MHHQWPPSWLTILDPLLGHFGNLSYFGHRGTHYDDNTATADRNIPRIFSGSHILIRNILFGFKQNVHKRNHLRHHETLDSISHASDIVTK